MRLSWGPRSRVKVETPLAQFGVSAGCQPPDKSFTQYPSSVNMTGVLYSADHKGVISPAPRGALGSRGALTG